MNFWRILFSILLPPVGVFLKVGLGMHFWLNLLLTLLGYVPGIVHAVWVLTRDESHFQRPHVEQRRPTTVSRHGHRHA